MPSNKVHCAISKQRTGKTYKEMHRWIDTNEDDKTSDHRKKNHYYCKATKDHIFYHFGGAEAVSEWLFHIALDNLDTYFRSEWEYNGNENNFVQFGFKENGFIFVDERCYDDEDDLEEEFIEMDD